ncbi:hypothetical protein GCM10007391_29870 [Alteromonas halophila]|uniref:Uncharacterized protein n=1 Tax=Alteromonas halophila TaxID=516698 RepID=A0A918JS01_9ALTE|nr:hypothetical protein GCM10007391_29870 [Alteromonas halophila]
MTSATAVPLMPYSVTSAHIEVAVSACETPRQALFAIAESAGYRYLIRIFDLTEPD